MLKYIIKRLIYTIPTIFLITIIVFSIIHLIPGDPIKLIYGVRATEENIAVARAQLNLDKPVAVQYYLWIKKLLHGDLGESLRSGESISKLIFNSLGPTLLLTITALIFSVIISIFLGSIAAYKRNTIFDFATMSFAILGISLPVFWTGIMFILFFSLFLRVLPSMGYVSFLENPIGALKYLILPVGTLAFSLAGYSTRMTRSQMIEVLSQDYIRTARAKGLLERIVLYRHALKNALIPIITVIGLQFGYLMGGQVLIEEIFAWPGIGRLVLEAIMNRDYTVVQGVVLVIAIIFVFLNLCIDIIYTFLNPKIRYK